MDGVHDGVRIRSIKENHKFSGFKNHPNNRKTEE